MSDLKNRYQDILKELEEHIQSEEEKRFVIGKFQELSMVFMDIIDRLTYITDMRVREVEEKQKEIESKLGMVQNAVNGIENDIYEEGEDYEFEIACPYCNHKFVEDINSSISTEIECPECHNIIELDWNGEEECEHSCTNCSQDCMEREDLTDKSDKAKKEEIEQKQVQEDDEEEDM